MRKNLIRRAVVLVVCLAFLGISASSALAAKPSRPNLRSTFMKSYTFFVHMLPSLGDLFSKTKPSTSLGNATGAIVKPTGDGGPQPQPPKK